MLKILLVLNIVCFAGEADTTSADGVGLVIGDVAPPIVLRNIFGKSVSLAKNYVGKYNIIVAFSASYCLPCRKELPLLEQLVRKYPDDLRLLIIDISKKSEKNLASFIRNNGIKSQLLIDCYKKTADRYDVEKIPAVFLIDKSGEIIFKSEGYRSNEGLKGLRKITQILIGYQKGSNYEK